MMPQDLFVSVLFALLALRIIAVANAVESAIDIPKRKSTVALLASALLLATFPEELGNAPPAKPYTPPPPHRPRTRRSVHSIFQEMGPYYVRRAYRMKQEHFWRLHRILLPHFPRGHLKPRSGSKKTWKNGAKNGIIPTPTRLSCALRYFAGGSPYDIAVMHGISNSEVYDSAWMVMNAVNQCKELSIKYPTDHGEQRRIAKAFENKSKAGFPMCAGAIDGILIWIEKPNSNECELAKCGPKRFFCGRKKKFGLNMQGTCDVEGRFLNVSIGHPGSTSDFLSFSTSRLCHQLEKRGFLAEGLCLFGDNAYVNTHYMATPYTSAKVGPKFDYNYYHSNVRIKIECCFGMFVKRWGLLRQPMSAAFGMKKTTSLVCCLARLHNFAIDCRLADKQSQDGAVETPPEPTDIAPPLAIDEAEVESNGGIPLVRTEQNEASPEQLLHGGEHFQDVPHYHRQQYKRLHSTGTLPREILFGMVCEQGLKRPTPAAWLNDSK